ncbi:hypothetical protein BGZ99_007405 [Dissophora globulifera]|uniref:Arm-like repeat domain-containing protein n=1 Tax=Dissophora globulifera TaxID=979702 RepID=A0A9P6RAV2_9FUNG|nr:hypothetical protein BGZ99_007405 [Dissophora globulifera]
MAPLMSSSAPHVSPTTSLQIANVLLGEAQKAHKLLDKETVETCCYLAKKLLFKIKEPSPKASIKDKLDQSLRERIAHALREHSELVKNDKDAKASRTKANKFAPQPKNIGAPLTPPASSTSTMHSTSSSSSYTLSATSSPSPPAITSTPATQNTVSSSRMSITKTSTTDIANVDEAIFPDNIRPPGLPLSLPPPFKTVNDIPQLVSCLSLIRQRSSGELRKDALSLDANASRWLTETGSIGTEVTRLKDLAKDLIRAFSADELQDKEVVAQILHLVPVLGKEACRSLLSQFIKILEEKILNFAALNGLAHLIRHSFPGNLREQDLVTALELMSKRLQDTFEKSPKDIYELVSTISNVLDAMTYAEMPKLDRDRIFMPLYSFLVELWTSSDYHLQYKANYAFQAIIHISDNESTWHAGWRHSSNVVLGVLNIACGIHGLNIDSCVEGIKKLQFELKGAGTFLQRFKAASVQNDIVDRFRIALRSKSKEAWYWALREADIYLREGRLLDFKKLVSDAACRHEPWFQWGICERLGDLAVNRIWDIEARQSAIQLLATLYEQDADWSVHNDTFARLNIKKYILDILQQLSELAGKDLPVATILQSLANVGDKATRDMYKQCKKYGPSRFTLNTGVPLPNSQSLLERVQNDASVELELLRIAYKVIGEQKLAVYIRSSAKANPLAPDDLTEPLGEVVDKFLESNRMVLLILGDSGLGKTTFAKVLERDQWKKYISKTDNANNTDNSEPPRIPLFITLSTIQRPDIDLIPEQLRKDGLNDTQIRKLKEQKREFLLICDGYDESQQLKNLYKSNNFNDEGQWKARMIINCRLEYVGRDYHERFSPNDQLLFQEAVMIPFTPKHIDDYIKSYIETSRPRPQWSKHQCDELLENIPGLRELVKNPFLMYLWLEVLPRFLNQGRDFDDRTITRVELLDEFVTQWLEREKKRLRDSIVSNDERGKSFNRLCNPNFVQNSKDFLKDLAMAVYENQGGLSTVTYFKRCNRDNWKDRFFSLDDDTTLLCEVCPLNRTGNQIQFLHRSILEYGMSLAIYDPAEEEIISNIPPSPPLTRRRFSFDGPLPLEETPDPNSPLAKRSYVDEPAILQLLAERIQQDSAPTFERQLQGYIEGSKRHKTLRVAAANAITILIRAEVSFSGKDLRKIKVPTADLNSGVFDFAQLQGADLRGTDLRGARLHKANLSGAQMDEARFGSWLSLEDEPMRYDFKYSPDGNYFVARTSWGLVRLYDTATWTFVCLGSHGRREELMCFAFSPDSSKLATGSDDGTVSVWDIKNKDMIQQPEISWKVHASGVKGLVFSPKGQFLASGSFDRNVIRYNLHTREALPIVKPSSNAHGLIDVVFTSEEDVLASYCSGNVLQLKGSLQMEYIHILIPLHRGSRIERHKAYITFSPDKRHIAVYSLGHAVNIYDTTTGKLICHSENFNRDHVVQSILYSPDGKQMAVRIKNQDKDGTILLLDPTTSRHGHELRGHIGEIYDIAFSLNEQREQQIATAGQDMTLRLWNVKSGTLDAVLSGHSGPVDHLAFSPGDKRVQIASGGLDGAIRLWDIQPSGLKSSGRRHSTYVQTIAYVPGGPYIISRCSESVIAWEKEHGKPLQIPRGCKHQSRSMTPSPYGLQVMIVGRDYMVRLWDVEKKKLETLGKTCDQLRSVTAVFSTDGARVAFPGAEGIIEIWNSRTRRLERCLEEHKDPVVSLLFSPVENSKLATVSKESYVRVWDVETGSCTHDFSWNVTTIEQVMFSEDGTRIVAVSRDCRVRSWDLKTKTVLSTFATGSGMFLALTPDGTHFIGISRELLTPRNSTRKLLRTFQVYSISKERLLYNFGTIDQLTPAKAPPIAVVSPDGKMLATFYNEKTIRIRELSTGREVGCLSSRGHVMCLAWDMSTPTKASATTEEQGGDNEKDELSLYLAAGYAEWDVTVWKLEKTIPFTEDNTQRGPKVDNWEYKFALQWTSAHSKFNAEGAIIEGTTLSEANSNLLKQNGAIGESMNCVDS